MSFIDKIIKIVISLLILSISIASCEQKNNKIEIANQYYSILNNSDYSKIPTLLIDSLITKEIEYKKTFSQEEYIELLKWVSVFEAEYKVLEIEEENGIIKTKVLQKDKRILFLHESPIITNQIIRFKNNKITSIEIVKYVAFNDTIFIKNRTKLLNWIDKNHPELKGFLHDQTEQGALKYLKAINLYKEAN